MKKILNSLKNWIRELTWVGKVWCASIGVAIVLGLPGFIVLLMNFVLGAPLPQAHSTAFTLGTIAYFITFIDTILLLSGKLPMFKDDHKTE
ncbi:hypothetical protein C5B42_04560 [Candidatus Cerribacteria bacterium 'Amazon FNV 2010 28 9']|uniref:Uncharacterized protein n=1 Tax=Candidatus Cerribacteria bacterium 'Amazon FNV 2010 28 9' TaxID=2081795 RepID=A0A317JMT9_9BACT|nr:MAG: hypothetical protein C5B42_04560 [Candidatus Cerribacteria bacterium 'Amazon FNV 2010 28 9']